MSYCDVFGKPTHVLITAKVDGKPVNLSIFIKQYEALKELANERRKLPLSIHPDAD